MKRRYLQSSSLLFVQAQTGVTLVELIISMTVGLFIAMAATALLLSAKSSYLMLDDDVQVQSTGRYAIEVVSRAVRQASYAGRDATAGAEAGRNVTGGSLYGLDARSLKSRTPAIESPLARSINGSDVLAVRFRGSGDEPNGDGVMVNCAGFGIAAGDSKSAQDDSRGWSVFYVAEDANGEPELYCKFQGDSGWSSQAIARGVESFQVLYGLDTDGDGLPNRFVNATTLSAMDNALGLAGAEPQAADKNHKSHWNNVVGVKIALLLRGAHTLRNGNLNAEYDLFGKEYTNAFSAEDTGTRIREVAMPRSVQGKERRIFATTIYLLNRQAQSAGGES